MAYPILTLLIALGLAFLTFKTYGIESGVGEEIPGPDPTTETDNAEAEPEMDAEPDEEPASDETE